MWAVGRAGDRKKVTDVRDLLLDRTDDPDVVNRVLLCAIELDDEALLAEAFETGMALLSLSVESELDSKQ